MLSSTDRLSASGLLGENADEVDAVCSNLDDLLEATKTDSRRKFKFGIGILKVCLKDNVYENLRLQSRQEIKLMINVLSGLGAGLAVDDVAQYLEVQNELLVSSDSNAEYHFSPGERSELIKRLAKLDPGQLFDSKGIRSPVDSPGHSNNHSRIVERKHEQLNSDSLSRPEESKEEKVAAAPAWKEQGMSDRPCNKDKANHLQSDNDQNPSGHNPG